MDTDRDDHWRHPQVEIADGLVVCQSPEYDGRCFLPQRSSEKVTPVTSFDTIRRPPSLAHTVSEELLEAISSGALRPGTALPTERALSEQFGVSRTVIREAVRSLQAKGVLEAATGRGAVVTAVSSSRVAETLKLYVRSAQSQHLLTPTDIAEVRAVLELTIVELAAERAEPQDLDAVAVELEAMRASRTPEDAATHDEEFHRLVAAATHNALFVTLLDSINATIRQIRVRSLSVEGRLEVAAEEHEVVLDGIRSGDARVARAAMLEHLEDSRHYYADGHGGGPDHRGKRTRSRLDAQGASTSKADRTRRRTASEAS
ncbi:FadR/GntR family transcriptional regulator [Georgenia yuyongxinii]|uniref:FadR/GntR family transcriptional regulator n=1 Tax=Georgenia yuyongxinii TaxID=2589797 RepID=UPI0036297ED4